EDGIRDDLVTGVQTCALPISEWPTSKPGPRETLPLSGQKPHPLRTDQMVCEYYDQERGLPSVPSPAPIVPKWQRKGTPHPKIDEIGRASCRERVESSETRDRV